MGRRTKKEAILRLCAELAPERVGEAELHRLKARLRQELGEAECPSEGYIVDVLRAAGYRVLVTGPFAAPTFEEEYARQFEGILKFETLEHAERSLRELSRLHRAFKERGDGKGIAYARAVARLGSRRARAAARRAKDERARAIKMEIAEWFALWASSPETFEVWIELRKQAPEFRQRFGGEPIATQQERTAEAAPRRSESAGEGSPTAPPIEGNARSM